MFEPPLPRHKPQDIEAKTRAFLPLIRNSIIRAHPQDPPGKTPSAVPFKNNLTAALDSRRPLPALWPTNFTKPMGQQSNKIIKKKRRIAYHKRRKAAAALVAKKTAPKAKK